MSDLGGADTLSALQMGLIERVAVLGIYLAQCEAQWLASGGTGELPADYGSLLGQWRRVVQVLGVERRRKPPLSFMSIDEYCAKFQAEQQHMSEQQS
jgi:hypothetical protein